MKKKSQHSLPQAVPWRSSHWRRERLGVTVEDLISKTILAMRSCEDQVNVSWAKAALL